MTDQATNTTTAGGSPLDGVVRPLCSSCRFPLDEYKAGARHFGTHTAHAEWYCLQRLNNEVDRLRALNASQAQMIENYWGDDVRARAEIERLRRGLGAARDTFIAAGNAGAARACDTFLQWPNVRGNRPDTAEKE